MNHGRRKLAYYTIADASFYVGVVGLMRSLRTAGDDAPIFVVDCGLSASQRARLVDFATIVPSEPGLHPVLQKATGPLAFPAEVMVLIDADILVVRSLAELHQHAANGRLVAFQDGHHSDRWFEQWSSLGAG